MSDSRGGRFYVFADGESPIYEDDLTAKQRALLGLGTFHDSPAPAAPTQDSPQATEEVGPDV